MAEQDSECVDVPGPWLDAWPPLPKRGRIMRKPDQVSAPALAALRLQGLDCLIQVDCRAVLEGYLDCSGRLARVYCCTTYRATIENNQGQSESVTTGRRLMLPPGSLLRLKLDS